MIKVVIIDDEPLASSLVAEYLSAHANFEIVQVCNDGFEGMKAIHEHKPDLVFLDVQMPKINGFELLELLENPPKIIFTTAFDEFALKAFEANAIDYLLKPFSQDRFNKSLVKYLNTKVEDEIKVQQLLQEVNTTETQNRIIIKDGSKIRILPIDDIYRLEAQDDYVKIYTKQGNFMKKKTLQYYENHLPSHMFSRVHRSHLLNISQLNRIEAYEKNNHLALLKNEDKIPVSRNGYQKLKQLLNI